MDCVNRPPVCAFVSFFKASKTIWPRHSQNLVGGPGQPYPSQKFVTTLGLSDLFFFTSSANEVDYYHQKENVQIAS